MTTEHEALKGGEWRLRTRSDLNALYRYFDAEGVQRDHQTIPLSLVAAIRAQVDEDVRRLVEAAAPFANISSCYCEDYWQDYGRQHGPNCVVDDLSPDIAALRAALEPFKAVGANEVSV